MTEPQKQMLAAVGLVGISFAGLKVGEHLHPESNLLGGWALVFGPLYWTGIFLSVAAVLRATIVGFKARPSADDSTGGQAR